MELRTLVEKSRAGDRGAFTSLVRTYQDMAFAYAYAFLNDFQLAEDATQEAFLVVYRNLEKLQVAEAFPGWLRGIVRNGCCHLLRKRPSRLLSLEQVQDITASTPTLEQQMETQETQRLVQVAIQALPLTQREVTTLYYIQEFSQQEIATFLEIPVTTVNMRLHAARTRLKRRLLPMVKETLHANALPDDFAERVGKIVQVQGPVVDAQFPSNALPPIFSAITLSHPDLHHEVTLQVTQHPGNGIARCILVSETPGLMQGMQVVDTGNLGKATFDKSLLHQNLETLSPASTQKPTLLETGIKAIDLLCPFTQGGRVGFFAEWGVGTLVLIPEILHNLARKSGKATFLCFMQNPPAVQTWQEITHEIAPGTSEIPISYIPVSDPTDPAFVRQFDALDACLYLTRRLAEQLLYPAIDPFLSRSGMLDSPVVTAEHRQVALSVQEALRRYHTLQFSLEAEGRKALTPEDRLLVQRARKLQRFLTQPFFVAEPWTQTPGQYVPLAATLQGCKAILEGVTDDLKPDAFYMVGTLEDARTKASP